MFLFLPKEWKEEAKLIITDVKAVHIENPAFTCQLLELTSEFSMVAGYKIYKQNSITSL